MSYAATLFAQARRIFEIPDQGALCEMRCMVAGRSIHFRFASQALEHGLSRALRHLRTEEEIPADLTIWTCDANSFGAFTPETSEQGGAFGEIFHSGPPLLSIDVGTRRIEAYDPSLRLGLLWVPDGSAIAPWHLAAPFLRIIHWWALSNGLQLVHSAAVGTEQGGVLLVGRGGSGKSTTALACVGSELGYIADDYCLLEPGRPSKVHSLFNSGKADARSVAMLPRLAHTFESSHLDPGGKSITYLASHFPSALLASTRLRAIVVPRVGGGADSKARSITHGEALRALAPSTLFQLPGGRAQSLSQIAAIVREAPCWQLAVGSDHNAICDALREIMRDGG